MLTIFKQNGIIRMYQVNMKTYFIFSSCIKFSNAVAFFANVSLGGHIYSPFLIFDLFIYMTTLSWPPREV